MTDKERDRETQDRIDYVKQFIPAFWIRFLLYIILFIENAGKTILIIAPCMIFAELTHIEINKNYLLINVITIFLYLTFNKRSFYKDIKETIQ